MILEKIASIRKDLANMMPILNAVKVELSGAKDIIKLSGKTLRQANLEQPSQYGYFDEIRVYLQSLSDYIEIQLNKRRARVLKEISENSSIDYGERMREKLLDEDNEYVEIRLKKLEADEVLELANSVVKQFEQRGFTLNNITKLVVAQAQDEFLSLS